MADVPHFDFPFRLDSSHHVAVVQQDSYEDVRNCVAAALLTHPGDRVEKPAYGTPDLTFERQPLDLNAVLSDLTRLEPRVHGIMDQAPNAFEQLAADVWMRLTNNQGEV